MTETPLFRISTTFGGDEGSTRPHFDVFPSELTIRVAKDLVEIIKNNHTFAAAYRAYLEQYPDARLEVTILQSQEDPLVFDWDGAASLEGTLGQVFFKFTSSDS